MPAKRDYVESFWEKVDKRGVTDCWLWLAGKNRDGYGKMCVGRHDPLSHRVSWIIHNGPIPEGAQVLHRCDNPPCVNPAHLWLGTNADNVRDRDQKGRRAPPAGESNGMAKLTEADVIEMRAMYATGKYSVPQLAALFGIHRSHSHRIVTKKTWLQATGGKREGFELEVIER